MRNMGIADSSLVERIKKFALERVARRNMQTDTGANLGGRIRVATTPKDITKHLLLPPDVGRNW